MPPLTAAIALDGTQQGAFKWPDGDTATGGDGTASVSGVACQTSEAFHLHSHLAIFSNGTQYALPSKIGVTTNCNYDTHTHDRSGVIHVEAAAAATFTLGQVFDVWGMPLNNTTVGDLTDPSVVVYINDVDAGTGPQIYTGDIRAIELAPHREITIQIGTTLTAIPTYNWAATTL